MASKYENLIKIIDEKLLNMEVTLQAHQEKIEKALVQVDNKIKEIEIICNKAKTNISDIIDGTDNKMASKYASVSLGLRKAYNNYTKQAENYVESCKKYAEVFKRSR